MDDNEWVFEPAWGVELLSVAMVLLAAVAACWLW
jgi:hypothetical protein